MGKSRQHTWPVPFLQAFHHGELAHGKALGVKGFMTSKFFGNSHFNINLTCGPNVKDHDDRDDVALQIGCREKEGWVLNSFLRGRWGTEVKYPLNIEEEEEFYIRVEPTATAFSIYVNGSKLCDYEHRTKLQYINHLYIEGNVKLHRVGFEGKYYMVPFQYETKKEFGVGSTVYVTGKPDKGAKVFNVDLLQNADNIPLTISVRMKDKKIVRNTMTHGKWQDEELTGPTFPITEEEDFDLIVDCRRDHFEIIINGEPYCQFQHRESPNRVTGLSIDGDLELQSVYL
jgi:hypothetical protein